jgi:hypothetical protein
MDRIQTPLLFPAHAFWAYSPTKSYEVYSPSTNPVQEGKMLCPEKLSAFNKQ